MRFEPNPRPEFEFSGADVVLNMTMIWPPGKLPTGQRVEAGYQHPPTDYTAVMPIDAYNRMTAHMTAAKAA